MSATITVRNGTAAGSESLCRTCRNAHIQTGYADSEEEVRCGFFYSAPRRVLFAVSRCTDFVDKLTPTLDEMRDIAFVIDPKKARVIAGFGEAGVVITRPEDNDE
jgi:hypothetical protein